MFSTPPATGIFMVLNIGTHLSQEHVLHSRRPWWKVDDEIAEFGPLDVASELLREDRGGVRIHPERLVLPEHEPHRHDEEAFSFDRSEGDRSSTTSKDPFVRPLYVLQSEHRRDVRPVEVEVEHAHPSVRAKREREMQRYRGFAHTALACSDRDETRRRMVDAGHE